MFALRGLQKVKPALQVARRAGRDAAKPCTRWSSTSAEKDPSPYPRLSIRGDALPDIVGDHSWGHEGLQNAGEKLREGTWRDRMEAHGGQREITAAVYKECPEGIRNLVDEMLTLNRLEIETFCRALQTRLAITDEEKWAQPLKGEAAYSSGKSVSVGGGGAGATGAGDAAAASKKDSHDLKLVSFADGTKIKIIKEVRAATGLGLKEAKALVDGAPAVVKQGLTKDEADALLKVITDAGGVCELA